MEKEKLEKIESCQNVEPHDEGDSVKSQAIVKCLAVQVPAQFTQLQCNTDLNMPPSNWLNSSFSPYGLQQFIYHSTGFASFPMAHKFSDCLGEVDVISDAENIKNLLKLPYSPKKAISMTVHRIGNTLLIDEFDLQKYLLRQEIDDWKWLRKFIMEHILSSLNEKDRNFYCIKDKSRSAVQRRNLLSKFLYHSVKGAETHASGLEPIKSTTAQPLSIAGPVLPEADVEENMPDPNSNHVFNRNVVWTFEDIRMLIGTDMPIFGGGTRPCVSLRLRDMAKPINVLTGVDYWLDNLMCNVPEVVMCYHLDGIVQKYEIIKTEDLPYLENSQFSPQVVRNVAQNILAFLKANATKAGHTYWLFKGKNDDVVKLYDLTTLCQIDDCVEKSENPFTVPVAKLLYTVARNMRNSSNKIGQKKAGSIKILLENCIKLLSKEKYPQIVASSHYILADLHVPSFIDPKAPDFEAEDDDNSDSIYDEDESGSESDGSDDYEKDLIGNTSVAVKNIGDTLKEFNFDSHRKKCKLPIPLVAPVEERCKVALKNICKGLDCLQYLLQNEEEISKKEEEKAREEEKQKRLHEEQNLNMAKSSQPIPLPFHSLKNESNKPGSNNSNDSDVNTNASSNRRSRKGKQKAVTKENIPDTSQATFQSLVNTRTKIGNSWNIHIKLLLIEKACLVYATLAEYYYNLELYGDSLRCIYMAIRCQKVVTKYVPTAFSQRNCLLGRAGDAFFQLSKNWNQISTYIKQFECMDDLDQIIIAELKKDLDNDEAEYIVPMDNIEGLSLQSISFYESALLSSSKDCKAEILRRLGSVRNELGLKYMNWGKEEYDKFLESSQNTQGETKETNERLYETLTFKAYDCFIRAIGAFEKVKDELNLAFVYCNLGRFLRYRSHIHIHGERPNDIHNHKKFYTEAFTCYNKALSALGNRKTFPEIWDSVQWEYATATFTLAQLLQDYSETDEAMPPDLEKDIVNLLQGALKFCNGEHCKAQILLYQYRSGLIHYRLAYYHHRIYRKSSDEKDKKRAVQLAYLHYSKTMEIMESLGEVVDYLKAGCDYINLIELVAEGQSISQKVRSLSKALDVVLGSETLLTSISEDINEHPKITPQLRIFEKSLQNVLRALTKICASNSTEAPKLSEQYVHFKEMYATTLRKSPDDQKPVQNFIQQLNQLIRIKERV